MYLYSNFKYTLFLFSSSIFRSRKDVSLSEVFALFNDSSVGYLSGICFSNSGLSMVNISSDIERYR